MMTSLCNHRYNTSIVHYFYSIGRVATFFREIGPSDSKIHMLMSEVVNKPIVEGFVKKMSTS